MLTRDQILAADDRKTEVLEVEEWGGAVKLRSMSGRQVENYIKAVNESENQMEPILLLVSYSVVGENNERLFPNPEDLEALAEKSLSALKRVSEACIEVNGLNQDEVVASLKETAGDD